ncbi:MAG: GNAT family N-acetyltransferase [Chitinophagaceae bacterium]
MNGLTDIKYLSNNEIDREKWDRCIEKAGNGLIYSFSFYLDHMARNWDALVLNDYEAVFPLTWNKKYSIYYLYQPFLAAQLGLTGNPIDAALLDSFLKAIPSKFKYWDIFLNYKNVFPLKQFELYKRINYILDLGKPYEELYTRYRTTTQRNIKKAIQAGCRIQRDVAVEKVIQLARQQMRSANSDINENIERFRKLYSYLHPKQMAVTYGVFSEKDELLASAVFFFSHNRAYYILVGNHPNGKVIGASHALIDAFIKDHAGKKLWLDFEGSDIRNLAFFYSSFGAVEENFAGIRLNRLPFYLKWMK